MRYTDEQIAKAVAESESWGGVCRALGCNPRTGSQTHAKKRAVKAGVDFSHFTGQNWKKGKVFGPKRPVQYYLLKNGPFVKSHDLKLRLIKEGLKEAKCESCLLDSWCGNKIPLELDHVDGDHNNNELTNLRILCPNCHAMTDTYCGKNIGRVV